MVWPSIVFNLCVGLLLAAYLLRGVYRFERRADALMDELDRRHAERMRGIETEAGEEKAEFRARVDRLIAESEAEMERADAGPRAKADSLPDRDPDERADTLRAEPLPH